MVDFSMIKLNGKEPVYIQLVNFVKRCILRGDAADGDALPSRREVAAVLGINPNTVQKAFKQMEDERFVETPRNAISLLRVTPEVLKSIETELTQVFVREFVAQARESRLSCERVVELIRQYWEDEE